MDTGYASEPSWTSSAPGRTMDPLVRNSLFRQTAGVSKSQPNPACSRQPSVSSPSDSSSRSANESSEIQHSDIVSHRDHTELGNGDESSGERSEVIMSIVWYGSRLGAAYYDTETAIVHLLLDVVETEQFTLPERLINELQPITVVTSAKQDERFIQALRKLTGNDDAEKEVNPTTSGSLSAPKDLNSSDINASDSHECSLEILPSIAFSYEASKHRIIMTKLPEVPEHYELLEREIYMASKIPFDCVSAVRATGGLMRYLEKHRIGVGLEDAEVRTPILDFKTFTLKDAMYIDKSTYSALQIFKRVDHPSVFKMGSGAKEGLSLFGIMDRTRSRPGRKQLQQWFCRPFTDKTELDRRLDAVEYFADPRTQEITTKLQETLKHIRKLETVLLHDAIHFILAQRILKQMKTATASVADWLGFYKTVVSAVAVADISRNAPRLPDQRPLPRIFTDIARCSTHELLTVAKLIQTIMDKEESVSQNRFVVQPGIDSELDENDPTIPASTARPSVGLLHCGIEKHLYNGLPSYLHEVAVQELETYKDYISGCQILYMRRVGYLLALKDHQRFNTDVEIPGLQYKLTSEDAHYYKTDRTRELDMNPGDILEEIGDQETTIKHQLQNAILEHTPSFLRICQHIAELDCLISFAIVARELNYVRPEITTENVIEVKGGRHPLQEYTVSLFVPNDIMFGENHGRIKVITGPNACGKSIYLKQVGLIVFMAQIGSFVPAESAKIGPVNKMYSRIQSLESVSTGLSTFAIDLNQMSTAVAGSCRTTLVLVDEFGKGTATVDGVSLLAGCLTHWIENATDCPFVICSTHFHSIVKRSLLPESPLLRYCTLETLRDQKTDNLVFLYQLIEGVADCSFAAHIALLAGLPRELVVRGREMTELIRKNAPVRRFYSTSTNSYMNRCASTVEKFLRLDLDDEMAVNSFVKTVIPKEMETPKDRKKMFDSASGSEAPVSSTRDAKINSDLSTTTSDSEQPSLRAKRKCMPMTDDTASSG